MKGNQPRRGPSFIPSFGITRVFTTVPSIHRKPLSRDQLERYETQNRRTLNRTNFIKEISWFIVSRILMRTPRKKRLPRVMIDFFRLVCGRLFCYPRIRSALSLSARSLMPSYRAGLLFQAFTPLLFYSLDLHVLCSSSSFYYCNKFMQCFFF